MENKNVINNNNTSIILSTNTTISGSNGPTSSKRIRFIYELPFKSRQSLCELLDADNSWRQLGGQYMALNDTKLTLLSHALLRNSSPTNELLTKWESSNAKVSQLYRFLADMNHYRAMQLLKPFVNHKLKALCPDFDDDHDIDLQMATNPIKNDIKLNNMFVNNDLCFGPIDHKFGTN
jgi:hypothetical protein